MRGGSRWTSSSLSLSSPSHQSSSQPSSQSSSQSSSSLTSSSFQSSMSNGNRRRRRQSSQRLTDETFTTTTTNTSSSSSTTTSSRLPTSKSLFRNSSCYETKLDENDQRTKTKQTNDGDDWDGNEKDDRCRRRFRRRYHHHHYPFVGQLCILLNPFLDWIQKLHCFRRIHVLCSFVMISITNKNNNSKNNNKNSKHKNKLKPTRILLLLFGLILFLFLFSSLILSSCRFVGTPWTFSAFWGFSCCWSTGAIGMGRPCNDQALEEINIVISRYQTEKKKTATTTTTTSTAFLQNTTNLGGWKLTRFRFQEPDSVISEENNDEDDMEDESEDKSENDSENKNNKNENNNDNSKTEKNFGGLELWNQNRNKNKNPIGFECDCVFFFGSTTSKTETENEFSFPSQRIIHPQDDRLASDHWEQQKAVKETPKKTYWWDMFPEELEDQKQECRQPSFLKTYHPHCNLVHELFLGDDQDPLYTETKYVSHGAYRSVFLIDQPSHDTNRKNKKTRNKVITSALKMTRYKIDFEISHYYEILNDAMIMEELTASPRIVDIYSHCGGTVWVEGMPEEVEDYIVTTENEGMMKPENLPKDLKSYNNYTIEDKLDTALAMAESLADLHGFRDGVIVHDDVQLCQWLETADGTLKLGDFNRAWVMEYNEKKKEYCKYENGGCAGNYRSPEEYDRDWLNEQIDVFSFGNNIYGLLTGLWVFYDTDDDETVQKKVIGGTRAYVDPRWKKRSYIESKLVDLMEKCWIQNVDQRIDIFEAVKALRNIKKEYEQRKSIKTKKLVADK